jgi:hypothetical protein
VATMTGDATDMDAERTGLVAAGAIIDPIAARGAPHQGANAIAALPRGLPEEAMIAALPHGEALRRIRLQHKMVALRPHPGMLVPGARLPAVETAAPAARPVVRRALSGILALHVAGVTGVLCGPQEVRQSTLSLFPCCWLSHAACKV